MKAIPDKQRAQIIDDAFSLSRANLLSIENLFDIVKYLSIEEAYAPWRVSIKQFSYLIDMLESTSVYPKFQKYIFDLITPIYEKLEWNESKLDTWLNK